MGRVSSPEVRARKAFERACALYEQMAATLLGIVARLRDEGEDAGSLTRSDLEVIKTHQKTVLMVLDFEAQLLKKRPADRSAGAGRGLGLDLDAARSEVAGRLARLEAPRGT